jgi:hypothetical protein
VAIWKSSRSSGKVTIEERANQEGSLSTSKKVMANENVNEDQLKKLKKDLQAINIMETKEDDGKSKKKKHEIILRSSHQRDQEVDDVGIPCWVLCR